jgi:spore coat protein U-like protein
MLTSSRIARVVAATLATALMVSSAPVFASTAAGSLITGVRSSVSTQTGTGSGLVQNLIVYGRIAGGQTPLGTCADTVTS